MEPSPGEAPRRTGSLVYDSADDLQSAGSQPRSPTHESVSEFGDLTLGASSSADTALMQDRDSAMGDTAGDRHSQSGHADVEASQRDLQREDSASYQRRPPALAERQDSASNLQALAEAEAGLLSGRSEGALDPPARRDSAADLHVQGRQLSSPQGPASPSRASMDSAGTSQEQQRPARADLASHERTDSASELAQLPAQPPLSPVLTHRPGSSAVPSNPFQVPEGSRSHSPWAPGAGPGSSEGALPLERSLGSSGSATLSAARRLVREDSTGLLADLPAQRSGPGMSPGRRISTQPTPELSGLDLSHRQQRPRSPDSASELASPLPEVSELDIAYRQDSALDTLAAARQAIAAAHPAVEPARSTPLSPQAPADPLVQARLLVASWADQDSSALLPSTSSAPAAWQGPISPSSNSSRDRQPSRRSSVPEGRSSVPEAIRMATPEAELRRSRSWLPSPTLERARALLHGPSSAGQSYLGADPLHAYPDSPIAAEPPQPGVLSAFDALQGARQAVEAPALVQ